jgi:hypothetical protein
MQQMFWRMRVGHNDFGDYLHEENDKENGRAGLSQNADGGGAMVPMWLRGASHGGLG